MFNGEFWIVANTIAVCLRKQEILMTDMGTTCPKMTTRWMAIGNYCKWHMHHRVKLIEFFNGRRIDQLHLPI